jgi:N-methylhydantoinase B
MVYAAVKCVIDNDIESNSGFFRAFHITAPEGCFVNPQHPAPVAARGMSGLRVSQAIFGALAQAMPEKVPGVWGGGEVGLSFGGYDKDRNGWVYLEFNNDGPRGGGPFQDGPDGLPSPVSNTANTPIESVEADHPLMVERFELVQDSGGPGKYRGGLAYTREFRVLADEATFHLRSDRHDFPTWGVQGGKPGTPIENYINPDTNPDQVPAKLLTTLKKDDVYHLIQAGAGGYGDPLDRDLDSILDDVQQEKLTVDHVRREYGVVVDPDTLQLDLRATEELRASIRASRTG